jgi:hypothetical protein
MATADPWENEIEREIDMLSISSTMTTYYHECPTNE